MELSMLDTQHSHIKHTDDLIHRVKGTLATHPLNRGSVEIRTQEIPNLTQTIPDIYI
jgi:hypothetical protein